MCKKIYALLCLFLVSPLLTACFDANEINDYAYVSMIGIERGVSDKFRLTIQIPEFPSKQGGGEKDEKQTEKENIVVDAPSLISGVSLINSSIPNTLNFMHLKAVVVSEDLAVNGSIGEIVAPLLRYRQLRRNTYVFISKGPSLEFLKAIKPFLGGLVTESIEELIQRSKNTGFFPEMTLDDMYNGIKSNFSQFLGIYANLNKGENFQEDGPKYEGQYKTPGDLYAGDIPRKGGQEVELLGSSVSDGDKMVGKLTGFETQMVLLLRNELKRIAFTIQDPIKPEYIIPIEIKEFENPAIDVDVSGDKPKIKVELRLEGDITTIQSRINYEDPKMKKTVEEAFNKYVEKGIRETFEKCQALKTDVFNFGSIAVRKFWTIPEWESYRWVEKFSSAELSVNVDFTVRRTGTILKSEPIISSEGKE